MLGAPAEPASTQTEIEMDLSSRVSWTRWRGRRTAILSASLDGARVGFAEIEAHRTSITLMHSGRSVAAAIARSAALITSGPGSNHG